MTIIEILMQVLTPIVIVGLLVACIVYITRLRFELNAYAENLLGIPGETVEYDDRDLRRMIDRRLTMFETRLTKLVRDQEKAAPAAAVAPVPPLKNELPVEYATRMARAGAGVDDLVKSCGLTIGEAQLLLRLHAAKRVPATGTHH